MIRHKLVDLGPADVVHVGCLVVTSATRTLADLGAVADEETVEVAMESALQQRLTSVPRLEWQLRRSGANGRRGTAVLRRVLAMRPRGAPPAGSALEVKFIRLLRAARLPHSRRQFPVTTVNGIRYIDFAFPSLILGVELGGAAAHSGRFVEARDMQRHNALVALGWRLVYFTWDDVSRRPAYVAGVLARETAETRLF